jgi:hypothetical protein
MYLRTIKMPAGTVLTGALIKRATTLIVSGNATVFVGDKTLDLDGYFVLPASANRKQAIAAHAETYLTMTFATNAKSVSEVEDEFTDESALLLSRQSGYENQVIFTGE